MDLSQWLKAKYLAGLALVRMMTWLDNWREVWAAYRRCLQLPPLRFRRGFTLSHAPGDEPLLLLYEIFVDGCYAVKQLGEGIVIDLGANIGAATLDWATQSSQITVHAYEPNPSTNRTLRQNVDLNNLGERVHVFDDAVGREIGQISLWTNVPSLLASSYGDRPSANANALSVPMISLNEVLGRAGDREVALLKIDTEGAEADILEGVNPQNLRTVRNIVLEYHGTLCPNAYQRCNQILAGAGFKTRTSPINEHQGLLYAWQD